MLHEEIVGKFTEYRRGQLASNEKIRVRRHIKTCPHCRMLYERWDDGQPGPGLAAGVMEGLDKGNRVFSFIPGRWWIPLSGTAVTAALIVAAFWHPEKSWLKADHYFGLFNNRHQAMSFFQGTGGEREREKYD